MMRVEPLECWGLSQGEALDFPQMDADQGDVLGLSHARCWSRLGDPRAGTMLYQYPSLDLMEAAFPEGAGAASDMHLISITLWRSGADLNLLLPRSFTATRGELLAASAMQYGLSVKYS